MAEEPGQVKSHIDLTRRELGNNVHELEQRVKRATDWRTYMDKNPLAMVGLAFAGGIFAGLAIGHTRGSRSSEGYRARPREAQYSRGADYQREKAVETLDTVKGAMIGWAATQFKTMLSEVLPGFRQQYETTERHKAAEAARGPLQ